MLIIINVLMRLNEKGKKGGGLMNMHLIFHPDKRISRPGLRKKINLLHVYNLADRDGSKKRGAIFWPPQD